MSFSSLSPTAQGRLCIIGGAASISIAPLFVKLVDVGPSMVACHRMLWGGFVLLAIALLRKERILPGKAMIGTLLLSAFFFSTDLISWHYSILFVGPGLATILSNFQVFFLALYSVFILHDKLGIKLIISIPLALISLWFLLDVGIAGLTFDVGLGVFLGIFSGLMYTGYILTLRFSQTATGKLAPLANMAVLSLLTAVFTGAAGFASGESFIVHGLRDNVLLLISGVVCQGIGWILLSKGLTLLPPTQSGLLMMTQPILAFLWEMLLYPRQIGIWAYCGAVGVFIAIGLGVTDKPRPVKTAS